VPALFAWPSLPGVCFLSAWEGAGIGCKKETSHIRIWLVCSIAIDGGSAAAKRGALTIVLDFPLHNLQVDA
jgi:hypothetical protein